MGTAASEKEFFGGPYVKEPKLGKGAYCAGFLGSLFVNVGKVSLGSEYMNFVPTLSGDTVAVKCGDGVKLAKNALAHLS